jgi:hypothetical protein
MLLINPELANTFSSWTQWKKWYNSLDPSMSPIDYSQDLEIKHTEKGWGIFLKNDVVLRSNQIVLTHQLFGNTILQTKCIEKQQEKMGFDSVIATRKGSCALFGILSLVNHQCTHPIQFSEQPDGSIKCKNFGKKMILRAGDELKVRYTRSNLIRFDCKCEKCEIKAVNKRKNKSIDSRPNKKRRQ